MTKTIFVNLPVRDLEGVDRVLYRARRQVEPAVFGRKVLMHDVFGRDRRHAVDPRAL
jgi:hypothetical protein